MEREDYYIDFTFKIGTSMDELIKKFKKKICEAHLNIFYNNVSRSARTLGIGRETFRNYMAEGTVDKTRKLAGNSCMICGRTKEVTKLNLHHIVPPQKGGKHSKKNTILLCIKCHRKVHEYGLQQTISMYIQEMYNLKHW